MASFTDRVPEFNPYIAQLPVEAMVKVGMAKQQKYEEGVTKIQSYIDSIAGMDVMRDVDKGYLQNKLNELGNNLRVVAGADFSNFQLVNSVSGMATQITKDKFVQSAVQSTAHHRKMTQMMEDDRKNGKLTPDNQDYYNKRLYNYLNNNNLGQEDGSPISFNAQYIPNFDVFKFVKESFDAIKPDGFSYDQVYVTDSNGKPVIDKATGKPVYSPVLVRMEKEGIFPAKVKETLDQIFSDPRVSQQLAITGEYNYKNYTPEALMAKVNQQRDASLATVNNMLLELNMKKNSGQDVQNQIDDLKKRRDTMLNNFYEYGKLVNSNPDAVRGQLYKDDVNERYTTMFGWVKTKETQHDNPGWKANFEMIKESNAQSRFAQGLNFQMRKHADDMYIEMLKLEAGSKSGKKGDKRGPGGESGGYKFTQGDQPSDIDLVGRVQEDYDIAKQNFMNSSDEFLWQTVYAGDATNEAELNRMVSGGMKKSQAISAIINMNAKASGVSPEEYRATWGEKAISRYEKLSPQQKKVRNLDTEAYNVFRGARQRFVDMSSLYNSYLSDGIDLDVTKGETITYRGKQLNLSSGDIMDLALYHQGNKSVIGSGESDVDQSRSKAAYGRLQAKGLGDLADVINRRVSISNIGQEPITGALRLLREVPSTIYDVATGELDQKGGFALMNRVKSFSDKLSNPEYQEKLNARVNKIKSEYGIKPNLQTTLLTGESTTDKSIIYNLRTRHAQYSNVGNESPDYQNFAKNLPSLDKLDEGAIDLKVNSGPGGSVKIEVVTYDKDGKRAGGLTLSPEEVYNDLGIDINDIHEPESVSTLKNIIMHNGGTSSKGDPREVETYINGDYIMDNNSFAGMQGSDGYDVRVNFTYFNGKYFPHVFVNNGTSEPRVKDLPGIPNLQDAMMSLQKYMTPQFAQTLLNSAPK